jgi:flagellar protein FlgJ
MDVASISSSLASATENFRGLESAPASTKADEVARQFESILLRQFMGESMKPLLQNGPAGQVYGYLLTDALADSVSKGGGLGLAHILRSQLGNPEKMP